MAVMTSDVAKESLKPKLNENISPKFQYKTCVLIHSYLTGTKAQLVQ